MRLSPRSTRIPGQPVEGQRDEKPTDGAFEALDQMANWVRFADTKATILTAGLGIVVTALMANAKTISCAIRRGGMGGYVVGPLAGLALLAAGYTLIWLVCTIGPQGKVTVSGFNRFAWPTLSNATVDQLIDHTRNVDVRADAWRQVIDLSTVAERKFNACSHAVKGFAVLIVLSAATVAAASGITTT